MATAATLVHQRFVGAPYTGRWVQETMASGSVTLDSRTRLVGVSVVRVLLQDQPPMQFNRQIAELWLDGRAVGRRAHAISAGGTSSTALNDFDPRPSWAFAQFDDPEAGRNAGPYMQLVDPTWLACGSQFGQNIQFRLTRYWEITIIREGAQFGCFNAIRDLEPLAMAPCLDNFRTTEWGGPGPDNTIIVAVIHGSASSGKSAFEARGRAGVFFYWDGLSAAGANSNILAHELGHALGLGHREGTPAPLMNMFAGGTALNATECGRAYDAAALFSAP